MNIRYALINGNYKFPKKKVVEEKKEKEIERLVIDQPELGFGTGSPSALLEISEANIFSPPSFTYNENSSYLEIRVATNFYKRIKNLVKLPFTYLFKGRIDL